MIEPDDIAAIGPDDAQRKAARVVGACYLLAMATAMFAVGYVQGKLIDADDAMTTAQNLKSHATLFRWSLMVELMTFTLDIVLITALYVILGPVGRGLALLATLLRLVAAAVAVAMVAHGFDALRILGGAEYLKPFTQSELAAFARLSLGAHATTYYIVFLFLGMGSAVFAWLWFKSGYVARGWGVLGIFASLLLAGGSFAVLIAPELHGMLYPAYMLPMFVFEVGLGSLLLFKGLRPRARASAPGP
jgi:Domain of unknown function (DUF4386)